jgi:hypothetical protein
VGKATKAGYQGDGTYNGCKQYTEPTRFSSDDLQDGIMVKEAQEQTDEQDDHQKLRKNVLEGYPCFAQGFPGFLPIAINESNSKSAVTPYSSMVMMLPSLVIGKVYNKNTANDNNIVYIHLLIFLFSVLLQI